MSTFEQKPRLPLVQNMGENTSRVFSGETTLQANSELYAETARLFVGEIRRRLSSEGAPRTIADVGAFRGELLSEIVAGLPEYELKTLEVDINTEALTKSVNVGDKVVAQAELLPFGDKSIDVAIMRYVLQWNDAETQRMILTELSRTVKAFALIEHSGADVIETNEWRSTLTTLFSTDELEKLKRPKHFFSSRDEVETWLQEADITFERLQDRVIDNLADVFIERYALNVQEAQKVRDILGDKNFIRQTDWIIFPKM
jgi:ubiquinone/menaquinone biosynthesis C-methylase UbiE